MKKASICIGANYGDEGKGLMTDYLCRKHNADMVVRFNGGCQAGHCQTKDTIIYTNTGLKYLGNIVGNETNNKSISILNMNTEIENTSLLYKEENKKVNKISLKNGVELKCTDAHKYYVWNGLTSNKEWVSSIDLNKDIHQFIFPKEYNFYSGNKEYKIKKVSSLTDFVHNKVKVDLTKINIEKLAQFIGICNGDGYYVKKVIVIVVNVEIKQDVLDWLEQFAIEIGLSYTIKQHRRSVKCKTITINSTDFLNVLTAYGCYLKKLTEKRTPDFVMEGTKTIIARYIRGLFDTDGGITYYSKGKNIYGRIKFFNNSHFLIKETQQLLYLLGIHSDISQNELTICSLSNLERFKEIVGFEAFYHRDRLDYLLNEKRKVYNENNSGQDLIIGLSNKRNILKEVKGSSNKGKQTDKITTGFIMNNKNTISNKFSNIISVCEKYFIVDIENIELGFDIEDVYDLTVDSTHSYIANGAISHNTVVTPEGQRHVFSHIGSGYFANVPTYLSEHFILNPTAFKKEFKELKIPDNYKIYVNPNCVITTVWDMIANQIKEELRGKARHGSCGYGIGETIEREETINYIISQNFDSRFDKKFNEINRYWYNQLKEVMPEWAHDLFKNEEFQVTFYDDLTFMLNHIIIEIPEFEYAIFEGAQGLALDQFMGNFPYVTRSNTGMRNVVDMQRKMKFDINEIVYVSRTYETRHGADPYFGGSTTPLPNTYDKTNAPNKWQETLKYKELDYAKLSNRIALDVRSNGLYFEKVKYAFTHNDQIEIDDTKATLSWVNCDYLASGETYKDVKEL